MNVQTEIRLNPQNPDISSGFMKLLERLQLQKILAQSSRRCGMMWIGVLKPFSTLKHML